MNTLKFKTNIKCGACVANVKPHLTEAEGIRNWQVDLQDPNRVLTVDTDKNAAQVAELVKKAGYQAESIA